MVNVELTTKELYHVMAWGELLFGCDRPKQVFVPNEQDMTLLRKISFMILQMIEIEKTKYLGSTFDLDDEDDY